MAGRVILDSLTLRSGLQIVWNIYQTSRYSLAEYSLDLFSHVAGRLASPNDEGPSKTIHREAEIVYLELVATEFKMASDEVVRLCGQQRLFQRFSDVSS